jgi:hypothetical protein
MRAEAFPGEDPATLPQPEQIAGLIVELARGDREPPPYVSYREWAAGGGVGAPSPGA